jgi:hypothetical protein
MHPYERFFAGLSSVSQGIFLKPLVDGLLIRLAFCLGIENRSYGCSFRQNVPWHSEKVYSAPFHHNVVTDEGGAGRWGNNSYRERTVSLPTEKLWASITTS